MAGVRVVTDSACDLSGELADRYGIDVVPLTIRFGDEELLDRRDLSPGEFWRRCKASASLPETAAPPPGAFRAAYERAGAAGADGVVCLTLSAGVSATYQAALAGAAALEDQLPVVVVDTRSLTMGQGLMCIAAAELAASGAPLDAVVERLRPVEVDHELVVTDLGPVVGTHSGPGAIAICYELRPARSRPPVGSTP